jgi:two-component system, sensor histidine kinase and response regulator
MADIPKILILDDEAAQVRALCDTLSDHGYETTGFTRAQVALEAVPNGGFDLLLTDLMMPEMNGIDFLRAALEMDPDLVGIVMTGEGTIATAVEAMKTGALDYVLKPFKLSAVLPVLSRGLTVRRLRLEKAGLEQRLRARTAELETANLDLRATNTELEAFSYTVSHDLRAPLRAICGYSHVLEIEYGKQMPADVQELLSHITRNSERMGSLIDGLLRFSQLNRQSLSKELIHVSALVNEVLVELRKEHRDRKLDVVIGELPDCVADPTLLKQVFVNLLSNAFKFTRQKERVRIEIGAQRKNGETIYFVKDNGAGFDMQHAEKLFGVFQRLHAAEQFEGTGIGLSIVQRIIERHGGRVWAEGALDKGATFYVSLPA